MTKTALITGASRGIGRAVAEELSRDHRILVGATTLENAQATADSLPDAEPFVADLADPDALAAAVDKAGLSTLDVLVHSAGMLANPRVEDARWSDWESSFRLNVFAPAELTRLLLPALRAARGNVIAINSGSGLHSGATNSIYSGTKYALRAFADALRAEEIGNIRVTSVYPGRVDTDMQRQLRASEGVTDYDGQRWVRPANIAKAVRTAIEVSPETAIDDVSIRPSGLNG